LKTVTSGFRDRPTNVRNFVAATAAGYTGYDEGRKCRSCENIGTQITSYHINRGTLISFQQKREFTVGTSKKRFFEISSRAQKDIWAKLTFLG
jgi:hypothetical protein